MSVYLSPIAMGILVSLLIIYTAIFPVMIYQYRKYGNLQIESVSQRSPIQPNFIPFTFVITFLHEDDLLTNTTGAALGFAFADILSPFLPNPDKDKKNQTDVVTLWRRICAFMIDFFICSFLFGAADFFFNFVNNEDKEITLKNYITYSFLYLLWFHAMNASNENAALSSYDELIFETLLLIWFLVFIILSIKKKQWVYYWETWCGVRMKAEKSR